MNNTSQLKLQEQMRHFLFGSRAHPFWEYDLSKLLCGLEVEYFIKRIGDEQSLFLRKDFEAFLDGMAQYGYSRQHPKAGEFKICKDAGRGYIAIEPEYAFHILEISLPPSNSSQEIVSLFTDVTRQVDTVLETLGFERHDSSVLCELPQNWEPVNSKRHKEWNRRWQSQAFSKNSIFYDEFWAAKLAATHVHLNINSENAVELLPLYNELEWIAGQLFSRKQKWRGLDIDNVRCLVYTDTLQSNYLLCHIPKTIPTTAKELISAYINSTPKLFPFDNPIGVQDYSVVRPREYGSVEFRSACSFKDLDKLMTIIAFRVLQLVYAVKYRSNFVSAQNTWQREVVLDFAMNTDVSNENAVLMRKTASRLSKVIDDVPSSWRQHLKNVELFIEKWI